MKKLSALLIAFCIFLTPFVASASSVISSDGYFKGIKLCGKVKIVKNFADIKVKVVENFPDIKVKIVNAFPNHIGEWQFVEYGEDFTVEFVENFPDIKIKYVENFPGL